LSKRARYALTIVIISFVAFWVPTAQAHLVTKPKNDSLKAQLASQTENLKHVKYVCNNGKGSTRTWHCHARLWLARERKETLRLLYPPRPTWGAHAFPDPCLREISRRETVGTYSPTIWNYQGSGAYGIGQALPASKMRPWGKDYMTNPWTQLKWMIYYVNTRYGGSCAALAFHNANGWY
jgi:hypothetical protein